jgi:hypothetical protein
MLLGCLALCSFFGVELLFLVLDWNQANDARSLSIRSILNWCFSSGVEDNIAFFERVITVFGHHSDIGDHQDSLMFKRMCMKRRLPSRG